MESPSRSRLDSPPIRFVMMIFVVIFLNFGLFFILNVLAPLFTGLIVGFLQSNIRTGVSANLIGSIVSYSIIFVISEYLLGFGNAPLNVAIAILIMGIIGAGGGLLGALVATKIRS